MRRSGAIALAVVSILFFSACGTSGKVGKEDADACKQLVANATGTIKDITSWMQQQRQTEGTRQGYNAAITVANTMADTSLLAKSLSSKSSSETSRKVFDAVEAAFREAALRIAARGGSFGTTEMALLNEATSSATRMAEYCGLD